MAGKHESEVHKPYMFPEVCAQIAPGQPMAATQLPPRKAERDNMGKFQVLQVVREIGEGLIKKNAKTLVNF